MEGALDREMSLMKEFMIPVERESRTIMIEERGNKTTMMTSGQ